MVENTAAQGETKAPGSTSLVVQHRSPVPSKCLVENLVLAARGSLTPLLIKNGSKPR